MRLPESGKALVKLNPVFTNHLSNITRAEMLVKAD